MLDSLREFAVEQLDRSGERRELRLRHRDYYAALASEFEARMATVDEGTSVEWLVTEHVNIEAALGCAIETGDISTGLPLATAVGWFWHCHGRLVDPGNVIEAMLDAAERAGAHGTMPSAVAGASLAAAVVALDRSDLIRAGRLLRAVIALSDPDTHARRHAAAQAFLGHVGYGEAEFAADALAVLDATATERAVIVSLSVGAQRGFILAAEHPDRVTGAIFICPAVPFASPLEDRTRYPWDEVLPTDEGWAKDNLCYWLRDYRGFLEFFFSQMFTEPHSTKPIEDCIGWGMETTTETLIATEIGNGLVRSYGWFGSRVRRWPAVLPCGRGVVLATSRRAGRGRR